MTIDRAKGTERIERDRETLAGPDYTRSSEAIRRYAYTPEYRNTLDYFIGELEALGFEHYEDPVSTLVARNRPAGEKVFGAGSHCDSNRNGGKYDGTMGVVTALEVCRLNEELGLNLPLHLVSFSTSGTWTWRASAASPAISSPSRRSPPKGGNMIAEYTQRQTLPATPLDARVVAALAEASGEPCMAMHSGAAHDTMSIANRVPSAMVFVPCKDGISHSPEENANPADAALGAEIMLNAKRTLTADAK